MTATAGVEHGGRASRRAPATPTSEGFVERDGVRVFYEVYGDGRADRPAAADVVDRPLAPLEGADPVPRPPRRVVTFDGRGNGRSDRPLGRRGIRPEREFAADALAVMDATATERGDRSSASPRGAQWALAARRRAPRARARRGLHRPRGPARRRARRAARVALASTEPLDTDEGWAKDNRHYWLRDYRGFLEFFFAQLLHRAALDQADRGLRRLGARDRLPRRSPTRRAALDARQRGGVPRGAVRAIRCPVLVIHGDERPRSSRSRGAPRSREVTGGALVTLEGAGHLPHARDPVQVNLLLRDFVGAAALRAARWARGRRGAASARSSSPRRSGSATRGATSRSPTSCARCIPDLEIDWLAQHPVTRVLEAAGERDPPRQRATSRTSRAHIESESAEHDLHCFQAWRRMDEILVANFMVFHDVVRERAVRPRGSATRPGSSTTSCTRTPS